MSLGVVKAIVTLLNKAMTVRKKIAVFGLWTVVDDDISVRR